MFAFFLSSGLFLGWSLGANDAANVFGTAVGTKMIRFRTAALCCSIFIILGAVISGAGASHTLGKLGSVNAVAGAFIVAFSAAISVYLMTRIGYPVSTSQAIVGAIIGWNFFSGSITDTGSLTKIALTWVICPSLAAVISLIIYKIAVFCITYFNVHMFRLDKLTRYGLLLVGAFGSYSLGANNIANVMGVFVPVSPFSDISVFGLFNLSSEQQLFFIGGLAIAVGVFTYSQKVMKTVGGGIMELSPVAAFAVVSAHSIVLFLFASQALESFLIQHGLPTIPLVPVSSSQAIVGAVIGIALIKRVGQTRWQTLGGITSGWIITPVVAGLICFLSLFFLQNVFQQQTYHPVPYALTSKAMGRIEKSDFQINRLKTIKSKIFPNAVQFKKALSSLALSQKERQFIMESSEIDTLKVTTEAILKTDSNWFTPEQKKSLKNLENRIFLHKWQLVEALVKLSSQWQIIENDRKHNQDLQNKLSYLFNLFRSETEIQFSVIPNR
jgi:PiT family inorganic phosphate transporter